MTSEQDRALRQELIAALKGGNAHVRFEEVVANFPARLRGETGGLPYSAWQLLEHIRLAQNDILRFSTNHDGSYRELNFPDDYWPKSAAPPSAQRMGEICCLRTRGSRGDGSTPRRSAPQPGRRVCLGRRPESAARGHPGDRPQLPITSGSCWPCGGCSASGPRTKAAGERMGRNPPAPKATQRGHCSEPTFAKGWRMWATLWRMWATCFCSLEKLTCTAPCVRL